MSCGRTAGNRVRLKDDAIMRRRRIKVVIFILIAELDQCTDSFKA